MAGVQLAGLKEEKDRNIETAVRLIRQAADKGAQVVMTPEVVLTGFVGGEAERGLAEPIPGRPRIDSRLWLRIWGSISLLACRNFATGRSTTQWLSWDPPVI